MKVSKKLVISEIKDGSFSSKTHFKIFKESAKKLIMKHIDYSSSVPFYFRVDQIFDDGKLKNAVLFILGLRVGELKQWVKDEFKGKDKKNMMVGKCYVKTEGDLSKMVLVHEKGPSKLLKNLNKTLGKKLLNKVGLSEAIFDPNIPIEEEITPEEKPEELLTQKEAVLKACWANVLAKMKAFAAATEAKKKLQLSYDLLSLKEKFNDLGDEYETVKKDDNAVEKLFPKAKAKLTNLETKLKQNTKIARMMIDAQAIKDQIARINKMLAEVGESPIHV